VLLWRHVGHVGEQIVHRTAVTAARQFRQTGPLAAVSYVREPQRLLSSDIETQVGVASKPSSLHLNGRQSLWTQSAPRPSGSPEA
jgi:hypothetical protein